MRTDINGRIDNDGADSVGVVAFDLLAARAESEKQKAESGENAFSHLPMFAYNRVTQGIGRDLKHNQFPSCLIAK